jgi:hypothetical protein
MLFLFGGIFVLLKLHVVDPMPMVIGLGALPIGIAIGALVGDRSASRRAATETCRRAATQSSSRESAQI